MHSRIIARLTNTIVCNAPVRSLAETALNIRLLPGVADRRNSDQNVSESDTTGAVSAAARCIAGEDNLREGV